MIIVDLFNYTHRYKSIYLLTLKQSKTEWGLNQFSMPILWSLQNIEGKKGLSPAPTPHPPPPTPMTIYSNNYGGMLSNVRKPAYFL